MTNYALDFSGARPTPEEMKAYANQPEAGAHYTSVIPYIGTPNSGKNVSKAALDRYVSEGIFVAFFHETTAGWMVNGGKSVGIAAANSALADLRSKGREDNFRCIYFACDVDITNEADMASVAACCEGAATVLGKARVGIYGEADVIDAVVGGGHAKYGCQTRAWSGGRVSEKAHVLQLIGYVYPGGKQCDRSVILKGDWGQWPHNGTENEMPAPDEDFLKAVWGRDVSTADGVQPAWRVLSDALAQAVAARDAANAAKTISVSNAAKLDALTEQLKSLGLAGGQIDMATLAESVASLVDAKLAARLAN